MTRRKEMIELLNKEMYSVSHLARHFKCTISEIIEDLNHITQSMLSKNKRLRSKPPICNHCGFIFKERKRLSRPTKCPKCKSEYITEPYFFIK